MPRTGAFVTSFSEHSPLSATKNCLPRLIHPEELKLVVFDLLARTGDKALPSHIYDSKRESWQVYVPEDYDGKTPWGLFVYISDGESGVPKENWLPVLKRHRVIFVSADRSGNEHSPQFRRIPMALDAVYNLAQQYVIDPRRVYIAGNLGGARVASLTAMAFPDVFAGGQFHDGAYHYRPLALSDGRTLPAVIPIVSQRLFRQAQMAGRYVFIAGEKDDNRAQVEEVSLDLVRDGFRHVWYLEIPGVGHADPSAEWFEKGLRALDSSMGDFAGVNSPQSCAFPSSDACGASAWGVEP